MRFIHAYLIVYFLLIAGATAALWQSGAFAHIAGLWVVVGAIIAIGLGILLAATGGKPRITSN